MRAIEDFMTKNRTKISQPGKGALHKLTTFCDETPEKQLQLLKKEFEQQGGQVARDWRVVEATVREHLDL